MRITTRKIELAQNNYSLITIEPSKPLGVWRASLVAMLFFFFAFSSSHATILALHNPPPAVAQSLAVNADAVRYIDWFKVLASSRGQEMIDQYAAAHRAGLIVVLTINGWVDPDTSYFPIRNSPAWNARLDSFEVIFRKVAPYIDYLALDNEPMWVVPDSLWVVKPGGLVPIVEWYKALAARVKLVEKNEPKYRHIQVSSPAFNMIKDTATIGKTMLDWANSDANIDVIDFHDHVTTLKELVEELDYIKSKAKKPLLMTEWSQGEAPQGWIQLRVDPDFAAAWHLPAATTNRDFIDSCYITPVSKRQWNQFMVTAPIDSQFMRKAFAEIKKRGFELAAYGAGWQYGKQTADVKQLYANKTVVLDPNGSAQENYLLPTWFRAIALANPPPAPVIRSELMANATVGTSFTYQIEANHVPSAFNATGLPAGLIVDKVTGTITGTPTLKGASTVTITAKNGTGTGTATLTITVGGSTAIQTKDIQGKYSNQPSTHSRYFLNGRRIR